MTVARRSSTSPFAMIAVAINTAWVALGPGPRHEEEYVVVLAAVLLAGCALCASLTRPARWFNSLFYPALFALGLLANLVHAAVLHDGGFRAQWLVLVGTAFALGVAALLPLNLLVAALTRRLRSTTSPPRPTP